jgi:hypothetical protein
MAESQPKLQQALTKSALTSQWCYSISGGSLAIGQPCQQ